MAKKKENPPVEDIEGEVLASFGLDVEEDEKNSLPGEGLDLPLPTPLEPLMTDPGWHDYVMSQFAEDEIFDGSPTCMGLRRVVEKLLGPILDEGPTIVQAPSAENGGAAVVTWKAEIFFAKPDERLPHLTGVRRFGEVGEVTPDNCDPEYARFASPVAATRAQARTYRKALGLKRGVAIEEKCSLPIVDTEGVCSPTQKKFIVMMCNQTGIDLHKFINAGKEKYSSLDDVPYQTAIIMFKKLSEWKNDRSRIPANLLVKAGQS